LADDDPRVASSVGARIIQATEQLAMFPFSGRVVPDRIDSTVRELIVQSYRLVYRASEDLVELIAIWHGARRPPEIDP